MSSIFVPVRTKYAKKLSTELYKLTRNTRDPKDVSTECFLVRVSANNPLISLVEIPQAYEVRIHPNAKPTPFRTLIDLTVTDGNAVAADATAVKTKVALNTKRVATELIPPAWLAGAMTFEQAVAAGMIVLPKMESA